MARATQDAAASRAKMGPAAAAMCPKRALADGRAAWSRPGQPDAAAVPPVWQAAALSGAAAVPQDVAAVPQDAPAALAVVPPMPAVWRVARASWAARQAGEPWLPFWPERPS
ncbi:MAG: hypothetical protein ACJ8FP_26280 [Xanthobacteraceae bacterium]